MSKLQTPTGFNDTTNPHSAQPPALARTNPHAPQPNDGPTRNQDQPQPAGG